MAFLYDDIPFADMSGGELFMLRMHWTALGISR